MNKRMLILAVMLTAVLLLVSLSAVSAKPGAIECELDITHAKHEPDEPKFWRGTVLGPECTVAGVIEFRAVPEEYTYPGKTMHFVETFVIRPYEGEGELRGKNWGVWNMKTFKYRANGWVLEATGDWAHMVGYKYHESGTTTDPAGADEIYAPGGWAKLVPANR